MKNLLCVIILILFTTTLFAQNNCLDFDGTDDYVALGSESSFDFTTTMTVEAWIWANSFDTWTGIITKGDNAWRLQGRSNGYLNFCTGGSTEDVETNYDVRGGWIHVACVTDGSYLKIYLNGKENASAAYDGNIDLNNYSVLIGENAQATGRYFNGLMDEVRIWSDDRSVTEIRQNMYRELNGNEAGLVAYYKFNEEDGASLDDATSSGINGTLTNMAGDEWMNSGAFAGPGKCLDFDGSDDYIDCGSKNLSGSSITLECWVNVDVFQSSSPYISSLIGSESGENSAFLRLGDADILAGNKIEFVLYIGSEQVHLTSTSTLETNTWYHIAGVYDSGSGMKVYINGKLDASNSQSGNFTSNTNFYIASNDGAGRYLDGSIDEVRIWDDARTAEEIQNNMCRTLDGDEANLVAYYRFDQQPTTGQTTLYDITSNENSGTLANMDETTAWVSCTAFDTWIGWFDTSWGESKNWSRGVPTSTENVGLFKWTLGHAPTVGSSSSAKTLIIGLDETLTLSSGLSIYGNLFELGELTHNSQTVTCAGSDAQYLVGSLHFHDLVINNSSSDKKVSAWWTTSLQVDNNLTVTDGTFYSKSDYDNVYIAPDGTLELSGDITVSGNWDNDGTFTHNDHKVTFDGTSSQTILGDNSSTFYDMTVNNSSGVVFENSNTVNNTLDLNYNSKITLGSNTLTIGSSCSMTNYSPFSYIVTNGNGVLKRNSVGSGLIPFPVGNSAYNPVFMNNSGTADNFSVKVADGTPSNIGDATRVVNRTWTITEDAAGGSNVSLLLQWNGGETGVNFNLNVQLVMGRYLGSGTSWETKSASGLGEDPYGATAAGFTSFSDFVVASGGSGTLPVVLSTFTAQFIENTPTIYWSTQSETDNMGWFLYRNQENDFTTSEVVSDMIEGNGTTTQLSNYVYEDNIQNPKEGSSYYYWLESIDYSGIVHHYTQVAVLNIPDTGNSGNSGLVEPERFGLFQNEPNPVVSSTRIAFNLTETAQVDLAIYNLKGQLVKRLYSGTTSKHTIMWDGKDENGKELESGVYFYELNINGNREESKKLILVR